MTIDNSEDRISALERELAVAQQERNEATARENNLIKFDKLLKIIESKQRYHDPRIVTQLIIDRVQCQNGSLKRVEEAISWLDATHPYALRSSDSGTSAATAQEPVAQTHSKFEVTQIFGPKSSSQLANKLGLEDPKEYSRLKTIAKAAGLIA